MIKSYKVCGYWLDEHTFCLECATTDRKQKADKITVRTAGRADAHSETCHCCGKGLVDALADGYSDHDTKCQGDDQ